MPNPLDHSPFREIPARRAAASALDRLERPGVVMGLLGGAAALGLAMVVALSLPLPWWSHKGSADPSRSNPRGAKQSFATGGARGATREAPVSQPPASDPAQATPEADGNRSAAAARLPALTAQNLVLPRPLGPARRPGPTLALAPVPRLPQTAPSIAVNVPQPFPVLSQTRARASLEPPPKVAVGTDVPAIPIPPAGAVTARIAGDPRHAIPPDSSLAATSLSVSPPRPGDAVQHRAGVAAGFAPPRPPLSSEGPPVQSRDPDPALARRLNDAASRAFWTSQDPTAALALERRAFAANPDDVEIAGNLAFYYLKQERPEARSARLLAIHALRGRVGQERAGRLEDWVSLGVASALTGEHGEAERAFAAGAKTATPERACRAALNAVASYGESVRHAATALISQVHAEGRSGGSPYCAWPPDWRLGRRYP
ncbi:MAG: hypothetical protein ABI920_08825 [Casimicrobiaceae bacterium]